MKYFFLFAFVAFMCMGQAAQAQSRRPRLIGIQPGATLYPQSPYWPISEFDINVIPIVFQTPINTVTDFKLSTIAIYRYGDVSRIAAAGGQLVFPRFFEAKGRFSEPSRGWYLGPMLAVSRDFYRNLYNASPGLELGKLNEPKGPLSLSFSIQAGGTYQYRPNAGNSIVPFASLQLGIGLWLKDKLYFRGGSI